MTILAALRQAALEISQAQDKAELRKCLENATLRFGFQTFNLAVNRASAREFMTDPSLSMWQEKDLAQYDADGWFERDPLLNIAAQGTQSLLWSTQDWQTQGYDEYHEYLNASGIKGGLTVPLSVDETRKSGLTMLSFAEMPLDECVADAVHVLGMLLVARISALDAMQPRAAEMQLLKTLSGTQMEILNWIAAGKTNAEISIILGLSRRTIDYHASQILRKLNVSNRAQAAAIYIAR